MISTCSPLSEYDTYVYLLDGTGATVASNDDAPPGTCNFTLNGLNRFSVINTAVTPNTQYFVVVDGFGTSIGQYELLVDESTFGPEVSLDSVVNLTCPGDNSGAISISVNGGSGAYTYSWSNGDSIEDITGLAGGSYSIVVADTQGCIDSVAFMVAEPMAFMVTDSIDDVDCNGGSDGAISISVTGATPGYSYSWDNGDSTASISGLTAGTYTVAITDSLGCMDSITYMVNEPAAVAASAVVTDESGSGANDGAIDLTPTGGTPNYTYAWSNGATTEDITGLSGGTYCCTITDVQGCTFIYCDTVSTLISVEVPNLSTFDLYPNPAPGRVKVAVGLEATSDVELTILDLTGKVLLNRKDDGIVGKEYDLDLMDFAQGTYLVRLSVDGRAVTRRLVISK